MPLIEVDAPTAADLRAAVLLRLRALELAGVALSDYQRATAEHLVATFGAWEHGWPAASMRAAEVGRYQAWMATTQDLLRRPDAEELLRR